MQLRNYQARLAQEGADLLLTKGIVYYSIEVRCGKTLIALQASRLTLNCVDKPKVLFVTKKKAIASIQEDYSNFGFEKAFELDCINYERLNKVDYQPDLIVIDEAHSIAAYPKPSLRQKRLKGIVQDKPVIFLSGTPTPESLSQLYHQFQVSSRSPFCNYKSFYNWAADYVDVKVKHLGQNKVNDYSGAKTEKVKADTEHLFISFTQKEAGFTSFVQEHFHKVQTTERVEKLAKVLSKDHAAIYNHNGNLVHINAGAAAQEMQKIHQLCGGTLKLEEGYTLYLCAEKLHYIRDNFKGKLAILYKYIGEGHMIRKYLEKYNIPYTDSPEEFAANPNMYYVGQILSSSMGVNLSAADEIILYNVDFSAATFLQVKARGQTKDKTKPCNLHYLFSTIGMEIHIYNVLQEKKKYTAVHYKQFVK